MIVEIGVTDDPERVGFYSGLVVGILRSHIYKLSNLLQESIFATVQIITIMPFTYAADRTGRKPLILAGMLGVAISLVLFGISTTFLSMILTRSLGGALGGCWA